MFSKLKTPRLFRGKLAAPAVIIKGRFVGRHRVADADNMAFQFRMGAGSPGSVNRYHSADVWPSPITGVSGQVPGIGLACVVDTSTNLVRLVQAGDTALTDIFGILVRPYPFQGSPTTGFSGSQGFGSTSPVSAQFGVWDVLQKGAMIAPIQGTPGFGQQPVYVWCAASSGAHIQGGFEASNPGGSGFAITGNSKTRFSGPPDSFGNGEIMFNI